MAKTLSDSIDSILEDFDVDAPPKPKPVTENTNISIWLPKEYRDKFDELQMKSKRKFGKLLREVVIKSIDKVSK